MNKYKVGDRLQLVNITGWNPQWIKGLNEYFIIDMISNGFCTVHSERELNIPFLHNTTAKGAMPFAIETIRYCFNLVEKDYLGWPEWL